MLYLILLLPVALAVCCCVLRPDGGRARSAVLLAVQGAELLLVLLAVCRGAELVSPVWHMSEAAHLLAAARPARGLFLPADRRLLAAHDGLRPALHDPRGAPAPVLRLFLPDGDDGARHGARRPTSSRSISSSR